MKKILFFAAVMGVAFTSCMNEEFIGDNSPTTSQGTPGAINFRYDLSKVTREDATGSTAAGNLSNQFIVYGEKNEINAGETGANVTTVAGATGREGHLVFNNYVVDWFDNSAFTTTSNTEGWEYVGLKLNDATATPATTTYSSHLSPSATVEQTIKYWDYGASSYTFTAVSALPADITAGNVSITKTASGVDVYAKGYSVVLNSSADLDHLYFAERVNITPSSNTNRTTDNTYGGNVTFRFHNMASKVRVAMYETIPGYKVTIDKFWVDATGSDPNPYLTDPTFDQMDESETTYFKANLQNCAEGTAGTMTVTYDSNTGTATYNWPIVSFGGAKVNVLTLGTNLFGSALGVDIANATYDQSSKAYTSMFPNETNGQNLKLKVDYTLTAVDPDGNTTTGETIEVKGATAEIDANYLKWKPGFAYTYIFKISPNTNGSTGQDVVGLYPITFDAVEMLAADGSAEYITTVSEPSITTFGAIYNTSSTKYTAYQTGKEEYQAQTSPNRLDIFATILEGSTVMTPTLGTSGAQHVNVFKVTTADADNFPITEASVAEAIANPAMSVDIYTRTGEGTVESPYVYSKVTDATTISAVPTYYKTDGSKAPGETGYSPTVAVAGTDYKVGAKLNVTNVTSDGDTNFSVAPAKVSSVPAEDGTTITIDALKLTGVKAGTYAIEYEASAAWTGDYKKVYKVIVVQ